VHVFTFILNFLLFKEGVDASNNEWDDVEDGDDNNDDEDGDNDKYDGGDDDEYDDDEYNSEDDNKDNNDIDEEKEKVEDDDNDMVRTPSAAGRAAAVSLTPAPAKRVSPKKSLLLLQRQQ
jgi:hypothetical protein